MSTGIRLQRMVLRHRRTVAMCVILGVAALLRFWYLDAIEHNVDHAYPIYQALGTLEEGRLPPVGQGTSVLFANPPLTGYLYVPALAVWRSPVAAYLLVIGLDTLAVWLAYRAVRALMGEERALIAAALMAVNPWVVEYSRATWVQGLVPFFACLVAFWLFPVLAGKSRRPGRDTIAGLVALTVLTQTYLPAFVAVVPVMVLLAIFRRRVPWRAAVAGGLVFAVALGVYTAGLLANWEHTRAAIEEFLGSGGAPALTSEAWWHAVRLVSGEDYEVARGTQAPIRDVDTRRALSQAAHWVLMAAMAVGAASTVVRRREGHEECEAGLIALIWFALPPLLMTWVSQPVHPFYLLVTVPGGYALAAVGLGVLLRWRRAGVVLLAVGGVALAVLFGANSACYYQETRVIPGAHALTALPLSEGLRLGRTVNHLLEGQPERFLSIDMSAEAISSLSGHVTGVSRDQRFPVLTRVLPWAGGITVVFEAGGGAPAPVGAVRVEEATIPLADGTAILFYRQGRAGSDPGWFPQGGRRVEWSTDRGLTLSGWAWEDELLVTGWRVDSRPADYGDWLLAPFVHAYDGRGERVGVYSGEAVPGYDWRIGQLYIQQVTVPGGQEGATYFEVGLYDAGRAQNAVFLPPGGEPRTTYRLGG